MPDKTDTVKRVVRRTDRNISSMVDDHQRRLQNSITKMERDIINRVKILKTSETGILEGAAVNLKQAQRLQVKITSLFDQEFGAVARNVVRDYSKSMDWVTENFRDLDLSGKFVGADREMLNQLRNQSFLEFDNIGIRARDDVIQSMYDSVVGRGQFSDLVRTIENNLVGTVDKLGRPMAMHAKLWANDALMNFHNQVNLAKAQQAGLDHFLYYGNLMVSSRDFCKRRVGKIYDRKTIESWTFKWQGKSGPAMTSRGGWNCRHHWQPVSPKWFAPQQTEIDFAPPTAKVKPKVPLAPTTIMQSSDMFKSMGIKNPRRWRPTGSTYDIDAARRATIPKQEFLDRVTPILQETDRFLTKVPKLAKSLQDSPIPRVRFFNSARLPREVATQTNILGQYSHVGPKKGMEMTVPRVDVRKLSGDLKIGGGVFGTTQSTFGVWRHEFGHHVHRRILTYSQRAKWKRFYSTKGSSWFKSNISTYGGTNEAEAFAESFAAFTSESYGTGAGLSLPKEVETIMENFLI